MLGLRPIGAAALAAVQPVVTTGLLAQTLLFADHGFATEPTDTPASVPVRSLLRPFHLPLEIGTNATGFWMGATTTALGSLELSNTDGSLDGVVEQSFTDGRAVRIKVAAIVEDGYGRRRPPALAQFGIVAEAVAEQWLAAEGNPVLRLVGIATRLNKPMQTSRYGGTGGSDGSAEIAGLTKPYAIGYCRNVSLQLVDPLRQIYQITDGSLRDILSVRDGAFPLTLGQSAATYAALELLEPSEGSYAVCLAAGCIRTGSPPVRRLTADIEAGDATKSTSFFSDGGRFSDGGGFGNVVLSQYVETTAGVIARMLRERGGFSAETIESTSFATLDVAVPGRVGFFQAAGGEGTLLDAVDRLAAGAGAWFADDTFGRFQIGRIGAAPASATRRLTTHEIERALKIDLPYRVPPMSVQATYNRNWLLQTEDELSTEAPQSERQAATTPHQQVSIASAQIAAAYPSAKPLLVETFFADRADALAVCQHLAATYSLQRRLYQLRTRLLGVSIRRGQPIHVTYPIPGLRNGAFATVIGVDISTARRECKVLILA